MKVTLTFFIFLCSLHISHAQGKSHALSFHFGSLFFMPPQWNEVIVNRMTYAFATRKLVFKASAFALGGGGVNAIRSYSLFNIVRPVETISGYKPTRKYLGGDIRVGCKLNSGIRHQLFLEGVVSYRSGDEAEILHVNPWPPYDAEARRYSVKQWGLGLGLSHSWYFSPSRRFFMVEDVTIQHVFKSEANVIVEVGLGVRLNK